MSKKYFLIILFLLFLHPRSYALVVGTMGNVYPVKEQSAYKQILDKAKKTDWKKILTQYKDNTVKEIKNLTPKYGNYKITNATQNKTYYVTILYTVPQDIKDAKGNIIYPAGFTFNVLDYRHFDQILVFFNAGDKKQVEWFNKNYANKTNVIAMMTGGKYGDALKETNSILYFAPLKLLENLKIHEVPCIAYQAGNQMKVEVISVDK